MAREVVGREEELASVRAFFDGAEDGSSALVLEGEPGIGKSTLWLAGVDHARTKGLRVLVSRPAEAERGLAYAGLGDLLDQVLDDLLPGLSAPRRRALEATLLVEDTTPGAVDARAVGVALRDALQLLGAEGQVLVAIDDLQWLDAASADALAFAWRRLDAGPVLMLLARRLGDGGERSPVEQAVAAGQLARLTLGPFSVGALHALLRDRLSRVFARQTLIRIHEHSGGNPFFALELAGALGSDVDPTKPLPMPPTLEELVRARLARLPATTRSALVFAAALGAPSESLLARAGVDPHALDAAVEEHVIERRNGTLYFTHPLLSSVLYSQAADRQSVHRRIADVVDDPLARARHLALATEAEDGEIAALLDEAVRTASTRGAAAIAAELAEQALRLTPWDAAEDRQRRALAAARAHRGAGEWTRAKAIASELAADSCSGPLRADALVVLAELEGLHRGVALLEDALQEASSRPKLQAAIHCKLAFATRFRKGFVGALEHARAALELADELEDDGLRVDVAAEGGYRPYGGEVRAHRPSAVAAIATAAYDVLAGLQPTLRLEPAGQAILRDDYAAYLAALSDGKAKRAGITIGERVARAVLRRRANDGLEQNPTVADLHPPAPGPGVWQPNPGTAPVLGLRLPGVRPLALRRPSQFRPGTPNALTSQAYAADLEQVEELGRVDSSTRTAAQTEEALFWTDHDIRQWNDGLLRLAAARGLGLVQTARLLAMAHVAGGDAMIACFEAKYHYWAWRPYQAIPQADSDGNPATDPDPSWQPLRVTPNFPEYPSAHACHSGAVVAALDGFFGTDDIPFTLDSRATGTSHDYARLQDVLTDVNLARVLVGFHFFSSDVAGSTLGRTVGRYVVAHDFRPLR